MSYNQIIFEKVLTEIVKKNKGKMEKKEGENWYQIEIWLGNAGKEL